MAVAFDAASSLAFANVSSAGISFTHTPVGAPTGVGVGVSTATGNTNTVHSTATYGGAACTSEVDLEVAGPPPTDVRASIWGLANPASGAQTVAVTFGQDSNYGVVGAITVTGGDTSDVFSGSASNSGTDTTATVDVVSASDELVMDTLALFSAATASVGASQTQRWNAKHASSNTRGCGSTEAGAATVTMSWTVADQEVWAIVAASFKLPAAAANPVHLPLLGVGA